MKNTIQIMTDYGFRLYDKNNAISSKDNPASRSVEHGAPDATEKENSRYIAKRRSARSKTHLATASKKITMAPLKTIGTTFISFAE